MNKLFRKIVVARLQHINIDNYVIGIHFSDYLTGSMKQTIHNVNIIDFIILRKLKRFAIKQLKKKGYERTNNVSVNFNINVFKSKSEIQLVIRFRPDGHKFEVLTFNY